MTDDSPTQEPRKTVLEQLRFSIAETERCANGKKPSLMAVPREYALPLIQDYAADTGKPLGEQHIAALTAARSRSPLLLVVDGVPVLSCDFDNDLQIIAGWVWPGREALREVEECPHFPGIPWFPGVAHSAEKLLYWTQTALKQADELSKREVRYMAPIYNPNENDQ